MIVPSVLGTQPIHYMHCCNVIKWIFMEITLQGNEETEKKTLEELSQEAAEFLDEKPSHKRHIA